ncbi:HLF transcription factor, PAR bZIP family member a [Leucoraja erinacea]|uniref:HLF transcription factor, PAR bZIP family member a n=1 Tax=Leucoraja erinaceus TaxID=7782 RepID=UPI00245456CE|nr:HLF transcription factor, PAR bZIP family member a [Leucoraja erinacea]
MSRPLPVNPRFVPQSQGVLKSLLENPVRLSRRHEEGFSKEEKEKQLDDEVGGSTLSQSAFLGPTLWDKTLPYDGDTFQLEYMDLQEFLSEYGIPISPSHQQKAGPHPPPQHPGGPPVDLSRAGTSIPVGMGPQTLLPGTARPGPLLQSVRNTPSPIDPESIQVPLSYEPDPADLALSSVPGQEMFDPRKRKFTDEELKPQPMIKKARKIFVPDEMKQDEKYWTRRRKNNMAAKRSRDARRLKENQIAIRASFLEKENSALRLEVADLRKELNRCKNILSKYDP